MVKKEINIYNWLVSEAVQTRTGFPAWLFEHFRQSVVGQVEFVGFVLGKSDRTYQRLAARMRWGKEET